MDFRFTPEQEAFRDAVRRFAAKQLAPGALARAHAADYPWEVAKAMAAQGLLGITIAEDDGGQGGTLMDAVIAIEETAAACPRSADVIQAGNFGPIRVLAEYGTDLQKAKFLGRLLAGEAVISVGMTEPEAGSAVTDLATTATPEGDGFRVNGSKVFTTHSAYAAVYLAYVRFGPGVGGIGSVLIDTRAPGVRFGARSKFMSGEDWAQVYFEDVFVPADMVVLKEGGFKKQMAGFNIERLGNTARSLALGRFAFEQARAWAMQSRQFGRLLCEFQGLQWKFAEMKMKLDAGQLLLYRAAANADRGLPSAQETAIAKAFCNQAGFEVANEALQVMGGMGYSQESLVEYCVRRCRGWMIAGGSIEILKNRIAEGIFERSFPSAPAVIEKLPDLVNADPAIVRWGRHMNETFLVEVGEAQFLLTVRAGRIETVERGPLVMRAWTFAIRASRESWDRFWRKVPEPGWSDLFALLRRGDVRFEGDQRVLIAYLLYLKLVLAAPRKLAA